MSEYDARPGQAEYLQRAASLNDAFRSGLPAYDADVLSAIRSLHRPIVVDFNGILADSSEPLIVNPQAMDFLSRIRKVGDVVIVTTSSGWDGIQSFLDQNGLWTDDLILMVKENWRFTQEYAGEDEEDNEYDVTYLRDEFVEYRKKIGRPVDAEGFDRNNALGAKHVAPIFNKPFDIPIIDDWNGATQDNPGMFGVLVKEFGSHGIEVYEEDVLSNSAKTVEEYYAGINEA